MEVVDKLNMKCKHKKTKDCTKCFEEKFGKVCPICKLRKGVIYTTGSAEGGRNSVCKCDDNVI